MGRKSTESILQNADGTVDDIVGGMKLHSKSNLFLYGVTKSAKSSIAKWVGKKNRMGNLGVAKDTGFIVDGKPTSRVISDILKSMVTNYQYGERRPVYKRVTEFE